MKKEDFRGIRPQSIAKPPEKGLGPNSAGQSGDDQELSDVAEADSESVAELIEEGQSLEAAVVSGVEAASDGEELKEVRTKQVREDDVPPEYQESD